MGEPRLLQQSILDGGIRSVNFFNGRLLTGEDLSREQQARRDIDWRLGLAIGDGVVSGLEVEPVQDPSKALTVSIAKGLAINRQGQSLYLKNPVDLVLSDRSAPKAESVASFQDCKLLGGTDATTQGIYLLTIAPSSADDGRAPTHALGGDARCATDVRVEAVQFRLLALKTLTDTGRLRNSVAWRCFGLDAMKNFREDPLRMCVEPVDPLDALAGKSYTPCDVPLAIVHVKTKIEFVDMWAVRRRPTPPGPAGGWSQATGERRRAEGEAMFMQFQDHLSGLTKATGDVGSLVASQAFKYLPAAGLLPMPGNERDDKAAIDTFFKGCAVRRPVFIEGAQLEPLLRMSYSYPPIDLESGEFIWLYWIRENRAPLGGQQRTPRACLVFASGNLPGLEAARLNMARAGFANVQTDI